MPKALTTSRAGRSGRRHSNTKGKRKAKEIESLSPEPSSESSDFHGADVEVSDLEASGNEGPDSEETVDLAPTAGTYSGAASSDPSNASNVSSPSPQQEAAAWLRKNTAIASLIPRSTPLDGQEWIDGWISRWMEASSEGR